MPVKPMLDGVELQLVQKIAADDEEVVAQHGVPALEGDFLQDLGRRASRITLTGVMTGPEAGDDLKTWREKFRAAETVSFVADIATATKVDKVLIEELGVRELAGKPERFEYELTLREFLPPPPPETEEPPPPPPPPPPPSVETGTLVVEVIVEGDPNFDFSKVTVTVEGEKEDGSLLARTLTNRSNDTWTEENVPPGQYTVKAAANPSGSASALIRVGQTTQVKITLRTGAVVAKTFLVHFRFDKAFIEPCMREVLRQVEEHAVNNTEEKLLIVGHTDKVSDDPPVPPLYNQSLSERRARSVFAYLTFGRDRAGALAEWDQLRRKRAPGARRSLNDTWDTREYQHILQDLGFYPGNVDGKDGTLTKEAVRAYRCHKGLPPGTTVDDDVWKELIQDYLGQDSSKIPVSQFFPNCDGEILKWLGCGEEDPVKNTAAAHRPNRRAELLFVRAEKLPCQVPQPDTFELPAPGAVNNNWCLGPGSASDHCCFVSPHLQPGKNTPQPCPTDPNGPWCREPAEPGTITAQGSIMREQPDGTLRPAPNQPFVLITPNGEFLASEAGNGEPIVARTGADGKFSFPDKRVGFYTLEVRGDVLVRLAEPPDAPVKGNAVCKALRSNTDSLDVVIINAPLLREIRLPAVAHLMTALHPVTREVRTCPKFGGGTDLQASALTNDQVRAAFAGANQIWRQARIRFDLVDIVRESYAFRTDCEVDESEFTILLQRCAYADVVNVFFFGDLAGTGEAGFGVSPEGGAAVGVAGCAVGDRFQTTILGPPINITLDEPMRIQVLAHEFGHFLNLPHAEGAGAGPDRLMLPSSSDGSQRKLIKDEVDAARKSQAATDDCVPLSLRVSGATRVGSSLSNHFIVIQNPTGLVTVDAEIPDRLVAPGVGTLVMTGGVPGANDRQQIVSAATTGRVEVVATYTPAGGGVITTRAFINVVTFALKVEGAIPSLAGAGADVFVAILAPEAEVTVIAQIVPAPFCVPDNLVNWSVGTPTADPLRRIVRGTAVGEIPVTATLGTTTRQVVIRFLDPSLAGPFKVGLHEYTEADEGTFDLPRPGAPGVADDPSVIDPPPAGVPTFTIRRRAVVRYPADSDGSEAPVSAAQTSFPLVVILHGNHRRFLDDGTTFVESYRGFEYLARHLASHGYIALSIDVDDINSRPDAIFHRGAAILEHIRVMANRNTSGPPAPGKVDFTGKIDLSRIGLIGHSRGGEGVVAAQNINVTKSLGRQIKGIVSIAPTNFTDLAHNTTPYLVIAGSSDGDVDGDSPFVLYDRATPPKAMVFVYGAIHNRFSTNADWLDPARIDNDDSRMISEAAHQNIAKGFTLVFLERSLRGQLAFDALFKRAGRPPSVAPVELHHQFSDPLRLVVDDFEQVPHDATVNTLTRAVTQTALAIPTGEATALVEVSLREADTPTFVQATFGELIAWDSAAGIYTTTLDGLNVSAFQVLSFRVTQRLGSSRNPLDVAQDFFVRLTDTAGQAAVAQVSAFTSIPFPFVRHDHLTLHPPPPGPTRFVDERPDRPDLSKSALKTIRLPLSAFKASNSQLNLNALQTLSFEFRQTPSGEIAVDDIEFSN